MNKKSKSIKTFALALALGAALLFPVPLSAQHDFDNESFGGASSGNPIGNQSFGDASSGSSIGNQSFGDALGGSSIGNQSFGVWAWDDIALGNQTFGALSSDDGLFGNQTFGALSSDGGLFGNQTFGAIDINSSNSFNNQYFGEENTPIGSGLTILLIAGAGYAFYKKQRTNNKQKNLEK
jgi:hypothetical protein